MSSYLHSIAVVTVAYSIGSRARTDEQGYNRWAPAASCRARCDVCSDRPSEDAVVILYQRFRDERRAPGIRERTDLDGWLLGLESEERSGGTMVMMIMLMIGISIRIVIIFMIGIS